MIKKLCILIFVNFTLKNIEMKIFPFLETHFFPIVPFPLV